MGADNDATERMATAAADSAGRVAIERYLDLHLDADARNALYHDDAVLEFPQSGERFEGVANFREWREHYPKPVTFTTRRILGLGPLCVAEITVDYRDGTSLLGVSILEFDGPKVQRERIYGGEPWAAPDWRAPWRAERPADP